MSVGNVFWLKLVRSNRLQVYMSTCLWMILKSIASWVLAWRTSKDSDSRLSSIEVKLLVLRHLLVTKLAARCCTIFTLLTYYLMKGFLTVEQSSMIGLTMEE